MSYTPTEWEPTDVVTATRMNALETAVGDMNMSYTPNTWSDGDILSAEKMNALEQAVASGGGGSSDFSTAQVTIVNSAFVSGEIFGVYIDPIDEVLTPNIIISNTGETMNLQAVLYQDLMIGFLDTQGVVTVSGNITYDNGDISITGDCTITIS